MLALTLPWCLQCFLGAMCTFEHVLGRLVELPHDVLLDVHLLQLFKVSQWPYHDACNDFYVPCVLLNIFSGDLLRSPMLSLSMFPYNKCLISIEKSRANTHPLRLFPQLKIPLQVQYNISLWNARVSEMVQFLVNRSCGPDVDLFQKHLINWGDDWQRVTLPPSYLTLKFDECWQKIDWVPSCSLPNRIKTSLKWRRSSVFCFLWLGELWI